MIKNEDGNDLLASIGADDENQRILRWAEEMAIKEPGYVRRILGEIEAERHGNRTRKAARARK